jgi:predicted Fe-Mo cluster-binding NifX family protein
MKIAVSARGKDMDAPIDPRFGRCACFVIVNTDDMSFEGYDNESMALGGGAGIQSAQFVASKGAEVVITGNVGPNAERTLSASGVELVTGQAGTVRGAVEDFKEGKLKAMGGAGVSEQYGAGGRRGLGRAKGEGRGSGGGRGVGMRAAQRDAPSKARTDFASKAEELNRLKQRAEELQRQIEAIESRVKTFGQE